VTKAQICRLIKLSLIPFRSIRSEELLVAEQVETAEGYSDVRLLHQPLAKEREEERQEPPKDETDSLPPSSETGGSRRPPPPPLPSDDWQHQSSTMPRQRREEPHQPIERHHSTSSGSVQRLDSASVASSATGRRSRSRSSSKERLLRRLAEAEGATKTPVEEDEVEGEAARV